MTWTLDGAGRSTFQCPVKQDNMVRCRSHSWLQVSSGFRKMWMRMFGHYVASCVGYHVGLNMLKLGNCVCKPVFPIRASIVDSPSPLASLYTKITLT